MDIGLNQKQFSGYERIFALTGIITIVTAFILIRRYNPTKTSWVLPCPFHGLTGLNCPGCGATRGMHALLNGDVITGLHYNVLLVIFVPLTIYGFFALLSIVCRGRSLPLPKHTTQLAWILLVIMLIFGIVRNLPFYPFNLLAI